MFDPTVIDAFSAELLSDMLFYGLHCGSCRWAVI